MMRFCIRKSCFHIYGVLNDDSWSSVYIAGAVEDKWLFKYVGCLYLNPSPANY